MVNEPFLWNCARVWLTGSQLLYVYIDMVWDCCNCVALLLFQDIEINVDESGHAELNIDFGESSEISESSNVNDGVARGKDALTVLDNPQTRFQFLDELEEVCAYMCMHTCVRAYVCTLVFRTGHLC